MPFFSVIIPTYNRAAFLLQSLQSVQHQIFEDFEIILIDDGSTDNTPELIAEKFKTEKRLRYFRKKNEERSIARNFGIQHAQGKYLYFFDSDDFMHQNHLEILHQKIIENPEYHFFATKYKIKYQHSYQVPSHFYFPEKAYHYALLLEGNVLGSMVCVRRNLSPFHLFHPEFNMCEDWIFNILNLQNQPFYLIDAWTITVLEHQNRSMANNQKAIFGRIKAMQYLKNTISFTPQELKILQGNSYRFCAIHAYLDHHRTQAFFFWRKMISYLGFKQENLVLLIKIFVGKKIISRIQKKNQKNTTDDKL